MLKFGPSENIYSETDMSKRKIEINKGKIQDNALKALVKSNLFRHKAFKNKKGKGAYSRKDRRNNPSGFPFSGKPDFFTPVQTATRQISFIFSNNF
ncbi:ribosome alternative rescue factor ArfA [Neisseria dentiae]|uniref:ribosome alternative rescue factor ArfA n=1 Tax=Neisseria dentiae TaxID=194197 RepID=UPI00359C6506